MYWLGQLHEMALSYWRASVEAASETLRQKWMGKAADCEELRIICDTDKADPICPLPAGHPMRAVCRRAVFGTCARRDPVATP